MNIHHKHLPNGLKALIVENTDSFSATALVLVKTGSRYEEDSNSGTAHFIEHTIFKGTKSRPESKLIATEVENLGGQMNAFTSYEYTGYHIKSPIDTFSKSFEVLSDMVLDSLFLENEIEKERGVIIEEKNMYEDQPMDKVDDIFGRLLFNGHPLGREVIGHLESIKNLKRNDFLRFMQNNYGPSNMLIVIAGGVDHKQAINWIDRYYGKLTERNNLKAKKFVIKKHRKKEIHIYRPINQSHIILGCYAPSYKAEDKYAFKVGNAILGKGFGSKLFQKIRDELGLAYYIYSTFQEFEEVGMYKIGLGAENSKVYLAIDAVRKEAIKMAKGDFSDEELIRAKNYLIGNLTIGIETSDDMAVWYGLQELFLDKTLTIDQMKSKINKINKDEIVEVFAKYLNFENLLMAGVTPHKEFKIN